MSWRRRAVPEMVPRSDDDGLQYDHLLLAIVDSNPYLNDGSKQACGGVEGGAVWAALSACMPPPPEQARGLLRG